VYDTITALRPKLDDAHGITKRLPYNADTPWRKIAKGTTVDVSCLLVSVQPSRGFSDHNKYSANCIAHHPNNATPIHWKCGIPELSKYTMATNDTVEVYKLDALL